MAKICPIDTVFDILQTDYTAWRPIVFGIVLAAFGALLAFAPGPMRRLLPGGLQGRARLVFAWGFLTFALLWTYASYDGTYPSYSRLKEAAARGGVVVEGTVEKFHPMPRGGHDSEHFEVHGEPFGYSDYNYTGGFNNTASHGGPIREGLHVRITHVDHLIVKLEVMRSPPCIGSQ